MPARSRVVLRYQEWRCQRKACRSRIAGVIDTEQLVAVMLVEAGTQGLGCEIQLSRCHDRALDIVPPLLIAFGGLPPELI